MDIRKLQRAIVDGLEDVKAQDIVVLNTEHLSPLFERVIIASGTSNRQTKALASGVRDAVKAAGFPVLATEGADNGEWIIVDCGAAVAHIMQPTIREYYRLEEIWGGKPVRMKIGGDGSRGLVKASEPAPEGSPVMAPGRKAAARKGSANPVAAKKAAAKPAAAGKAVARKSAAAKSPARKTSAPQAAPTRTIVVAPPARKTTAAGKPAARAAGPSRKATGRPAAKSASPARKTARRTTAKPAARSGPKRG